MFERAGPWPFLLGLLGCSSSHPSDFLLVGLICWLCGLIVGATAATLLLSRSARNVLLGCLGAVVREFQGAPRGVPENRLARYRVHEHQAWP